MWIFRRRVEETLNEQLLREAGLEPLQVTFADPADPAAEDAPAPADSVEYDGPTLAGDSAGIVIRAFEQPGDWDVVVTVNAPDLTGNYVDFALLSDKSIIRIKGNAEGALAPFVAAIAQRLRPPYLALVRRQDQELWSVTARQIEVADLDVAELDVANADVITVESTGGTSVTRVEDKVSQQRFPALEQAGEAEGAEYTVRADRLDDRQWGIRATAL